jgi:isocitrate dehydrogenase (NAD+)
MQLVAKPGQFDVMIMPNLYGAIISNIGAALVGGPGIVPGCNIGREYALFEPGCRHVAKDIMGTNKANPAAMILSSTMMLRHLGQVASLLFHTLCPPDVISIFDMPCRRLDELANSITAATYDVIAQGKVKTPDLGGECSNV